MWRQREAGRLGEHRWDINQDLEVVVVVEDVVVDAVDVDVVADEDMDVVADEDVDAVGDAVVDALDADGDVVEA